MSSAAERTFSSSATTAGGLDNSYGIFWDEYRVIEESTPTLRHTAPDAEDGLPRNKEADNNEQKIQWLNDVGFTNIAKKFRAKTEIDQHDVDMKIIAASLTRAQANAVRRRIDSLNEAIRQRKLNEDNQRDNHHASKFGPQVSRRKDVRDIFNNMPKSPLAANNNNSKSFTKGDRYVKISSKQNKQEEIHRRPRSPPQVPKKPKKYNSDTTPNDETSSESEPLLRRTLTKNLVIKSGEQRNNDLQNNSNVDDIPLQRRNTEQPQRTNTGLYHIKNSALNDNAATQVTVKHVDRNENLVADRRRSASELIHSLNSTIYVPREPDNNVRKSSGRQQQPVDNKEEDKKLVRIDSKFIKVSNVEDNYISSNDQRRTPSPSLRHDTIEKNKTNDSKKVSSDNRAFHDTNSLTAPVDTRTRIDNSQPSSKSPQLSAKTNDVSDKNERPQSSIVDETLSGLISKPEKLILDKENLVLDQNKNNDKIQKPDNVLQKDQKLQPRPYNVQQSLTSLDKFEVIGPSEYEDNKSMSSFDSYDELSLNSTRQSRSHETIYDDTTDVPANNLPSQDEQARNDAESPPPTSPSLLNGDAKLDVGSAKEEKPPLVEGQDFLPLPNFTLTREELGMTHIGDLSEPDMQKVRSLALIELTALFDTYHIQMVTRKPPTKQKYKDNGVFGVPLTTLSHREAKKKSLSHGSQAPSVFLSMLTHIEMNGLKEEGILRIPGSTPRLKQIKEGLEKDAQAFKWEGRKITDVCTCLKQFLRDLPIPLLSYEYQSTFAAVSYLPDRKVQLQALNLLVLLLNPVHQETLKLLLSFLQKVIAHEPENKMGLNNVSMIMAPNLFFQNSSKIDLNEAQRAKGMTDVLRMLIKYQQILWTIPSFMVGQIRCLYEAGNNAKHPKAVKKIIARRFKSELSSVGSVMRPKSGGSSGDELEDGNFIIKVRAPDFHKQSMAIQLTEKTTAADIIAKFQWRRQNSIKDETDTVNKSGRKKKDSKKDVRFVLCETGGNIGERMLESTAIIHAIAKVNPNVDWVLKTFPKR